jgi:hypothetical protein
MGPWFTLENTRQSLTPLHNIAKDQNVIFDVLTMGGNMLPCRQMAQAMLEEGVGRSKVKSYNQVKQAGNIVKWFNNTPVQVEFASNTALFLPSTIQFRIEIPQDNHLVISKGLLQAGKQH